MLHRVEIVVAVLIERTNELTNTPRKQTSNNGDHGGVVKIVLVNGTSRALLDLVHATLLRPPDDDDSYDNTLPVPSRPTLSEVWKYTQTLPCAPHYYYFRRCKNMIQRRHRGSTVSMAVSAVVNPCFREIPMFVFGSVRFPFLLSLFRFHFFRPSSLITIG